MTIPYKIYKTNNCFILLYILVSCLFSSCIKEECSLYNTKNSSVHIIPIWKDNTKKPEGIRVSFYLPENKKYVQDNFYQDGGFSNIRNGYYSLLMYNNDSEKIRFRYLSTYEIHEAYTPKITRPSYINPAPEEETFDQPDVLWLDKIDTFHISASSREIRFYPEQRVRAFNGNVQVDGMEPVQAVRGAISGMVTTLKLSSLKSGEKPGTVFFNAFTTKTGVTFSFFSFGAYVGFRQGGQARKHYLTLEFLYPKSIISKRLDVTHLMDSIYNGGTLNITHSIVLPPDTASDDDGFNANVGDWNEIYYPIPL